VAGVLSICALYSYTFVPVNSFRAAGDVRYAMMLSISSMFAFRVGLSYLLNLLFPQIGLLCVYLGMGVDWMFRTVMNIRRLRSGKWLHSKLI